MSAKILSKLYLSLSLSCALGVGLFLGATNKHYIVGGIDSPISSWDQVLADPPGTFKTHYCSFTI